MEVRTGLNESAKGCWSPQGLAVRGWRVMFSTPGPEGAGVAAGTGMRGARAVGRKGHLQEPGPQQKAVPTTETRQRQNWRNKSHNLTFLPHSIQCGWVFPWVTPVGGPRARWQHTEMCLQSTEWGGGECTGNWERQAGPGIARKRDLGRAQEKELLDASSRKTTLFSATSVKIRVLTYHSTTTHKVLDSGSLSFQPLPGKQRHL